MRTFGSFLYRIIAFIIKHTPGWNSRRVRVVLISSNDEILLVRNWLSNQNWTLPGGGIEKGEAPEHAAAREVKEETTLTVKATDMEIIATMYSEALKADLVILRANVSETRLLPLKWRYRLEIMDRAWHHVDGLPPDMSDITKQAIALALGDEN
jgi:8-oxo-dGTP pyrophosphatase MutT (NUDIX family)